MAELEGAPAGTTSADGPVFPEAAPWLDPTLRGTGEVPSPEPPCEHQWVLVKTMERIGAVPPCVGLRCHWVCECGEAKVVEYEV